MFLSNMEPKCGAKSYTLAKSPKGSSLTCEEGEDLSLQMPNLEWQIKELDDKSMKQVYLVNLHMELKREMEKMVKLIRNSEENIPKGDDVA